MKFIFYLVAVVLFVPYILYAESVFLKDGNIIEGSIQKEDDLNIEIQILSGEIQLISRENIIRTLYHGKYKEKKFLNMNDGREFEAYIIDEDAEFYIVRKELKSSVEIKIAKDEVKSISRDRIPKAIYEPPAEYYWWGAIPGCGQFYSGHYLKGTVFGLSFIGSATWAVFANLKYNKSKKDYDSMPAGSSQEELDSAYDKSKKDGQIAVISILTTSIIYALNWTDILFFSKPESDESVSSIRCGEVFVNLTFIPDYSGQNAYRDLYELKSELAVSLRF